MQGQQQNKCYLAMLWHIPSCQQRFRNRSILHHVLGHYHPSECHFLTRVVHGAEHPVFNAQHDRLMTPTANHNRFIELEQIFGFSSDSARIGVLEHQSLRSGPRVIRTRSASISSDFHSSKKTSRTRRIPRRLSRQPPISPSRNDHFGARSRTGPILKLPHR